MADALTKQGSRRDEIEEMMMGNYYRNVLDKKDSVRYREGEIKIKNLAMRARKLVFS